LEKKEDALGKDSSSYPRSSRSRPPYIANTYDSTMNETTLVRSPYIDNYLENIGDFENHTREIVSNILRHMGYYGQVIGKIR
jgi:hypothetical protein